MFQKIDKNVTIVFFLSLPFASPVLEEIEIFEQHQDDIDRCTPPHNVGLTVLIFFNWSSTIFIQGILTNDETCPKWSSLTISKYRLRDFVKLNEFLICKNWVNNLYDVRISSNMRTFSPSNQMSFDCRCGRCYVDNNNDACLLSSACSLVG